MSRCTRGAVCMSFLSRAIILLETDCFKINMLAVCARIYSMFPISVNFKFVHL